MSTIPGPAQGTRDWCRIRDGPWLQENDNLVRMDLCLQSSRMAENREKNAWEVIISRGISQPAFVVSGDGLGWSHEAAAALYCSPSCPALIPEATPLVQLPSSCQLGIQWQRWRLGRWTSRPRCGLAFPWLGLAAWRGDSFSSLCLVNSKSGESEWIDWKRKSHRSRPGRSPFKGKLSHVFKGVRLMEFSRAQPIRVWKDHKILWVSCIQTGRKKT